MVYSIKGFNEIDEFTSQTLMTNRPALGILPPVNTMELLNESLLRVHIKVF